MWYINTPQSEKWHLVVCPTLLFGCEFHGYNIRASIGLTHGQGSHMLSRH